MQGREISKPKMVIKRNAFLDAAYELFSKGTIESVSMQDIADASGYGVATLYRYFYSKPVLVVAVAVREWEKYTESYGKKKSGSKLKEMTGVNRLKFFLDSFVELYKKHKDLLRFNQFFNVYVQSEDIDDETMEPYRKVIGGLKEQFHALYEKGMEDKTLRADIPEDKMFSTTLHLMLAATTRYAVGLVYKPAKGFDAVEELQTMVDMLMLRYKAAG